MINNKIYIGKAKDINKRWTQHKTAAKLKNPNDYSYLHRSMNKYGSDNFSIEKINEYDLEELALTDEIRLIALFNSNNIGYNLTIGGDGASGYHHNDETKLLMSKLKQGMFDGYQNPFYGKKHSDESKKLISAKTKYNNDNGIYYQSNLAQCKFDLETCLNIQKGYLNNKTMETLANEFNTNIKTIHNIINGNYYSIKGKSIISKEELKNIKKSHLNKTFKFNKDIEKEIINEYISGKLMIHLAAIYKTTKITIRKILLRNNIKINKNFPRPQKQSKITEEMVLEIRDKYKQYSLQELANLYKIPKSTIYHIIKRNTWKNI